MPLAGALSLIEKCPPISDNGFITANFFFCFKQLTMDPYDSDSSIEEDGDFTETGVLLGYAAEEVIEDTISHLGGHPVCCSKVLPANQYVY